MTTYEWNNADELTAVLGGGANVAYTYDAFGQMVSRTNLDNQSSEDYIYDGQNLALMLDGSGTDSGQVIERDFTGRPSIRFWQVRWSH